MAVIKLRSEVVDMLPDSSLQQEQQKWWKNIHFLNFSKGKYGLTNFRHLSQKRKVDRDISNVVTNVEEATPEVTASCLLNDSIVCDTVTAIRCKWSALLVADSVKRW